MKTPFVHDHSSSSEIFSQSLRPAKRQRTSFPSHASQPGNHERPGGASGDESEDFGSDIDENDAFEPMPLPAAKSNQKWDIASLAAKQAKHRIHVPTHGDELPDVFMTQAPPASSNPWRIRGPIWQKPSPLKEVEITNELPAPVQAKRVHSVIETSKQAASVSRSVQRSMSAVQHKSPIVASARRAASQMQQTGPAPTQDIDDELADLPSDAFESSPRSSPGESSHPVFDISSQAVSRPTHLPNLRAPQTGLRQTTVFGGVAEPVPPSQVGKKHAWPLATQQEPPTHHKLNEAALASWVYPTNIGTIRDYQYNIVSRGLYHNLLVALPTGLGKTFIAATVMLNWFRWTKEAQIVFIAPTKPLVAQQIEACFNVVGIPRSQTVMLTGTTPPGLRAEEWKTKRVFFMTPQTIINDLKNGMCDPKRIVLLVVDEAHRATGAYAYVEVVKFLRRFNQSFRVLALTATPGSSVESVQQVIDGLDISRVEIRTEISLDIRQYVHSRQVDKVLFDYSQEQQTVMDLLSKTLQPILAKLNTQNAYWSKDPMKLTAYGMMQAQKQWNMSEAGRKAPQPIKGMVHAIFTVLASIAHSISLLKFHGIGPFYRGVSALRSDVDSGKTKSKYSTQIRQNENFGKMMNSIETWMRDPDYIGHPKLGYLRRVILNHFMDAGEGRHEGGPPSATRVMIFAHWRDSAEEIVRALQRNEPMIRPHVFVGQADAKGSEGMDQKKQLQVIQQFKDGIYNTLVATSIGEEGLDIGEIDLIICYDASASPIRMLQRMGRTGRKRKGNIVLLLNRDKEEKDFESAKDNYEKMQGMIASGKRFTFHDDRSPRIVPKNFQPVVDKRVVEIPVENSQAELPEPKRGGRRAPKRPPKKFNMPDGVRTGFVAASRMDGDDSAASAEEQPRRKTQTKKLATTKRNIVSPKTPPEPAAAQLPFLDDVVLNKMQERELERKYQYVNDADGAQTVTAPRPDRFPEAFRELGKTKHVKHGKATTGIANMLQRVNAMDQQVVSRFRENLRKSDLGGNVDDLLGSTVNTKAASSEPEEALSVRPTPTARGRRAKQSDVYSAMEAASSSPEPTPAHMRIATQGIDLGSDDTSGEEEIEGEPDSELAEFIVASDQPVEFASSSMPVPIDNTQQRRFYVSQDTVGADESDEDLPDVDVLVGDAKQGCDRSIAGAEGESSDEAPMQRRRKRPVVEDDSDD